MRPRADPCRPVVPASIPIAMPIPSSVRTSTCENLTGPGPLRRSGTLPRMAEQPPPPPHRRRAHTRTRDLERYAGLFAERTGVMRSSAMRDLMAITARPGGDLAGRRPAGHLDLPAQELCRADDPDRPGVGRRGAAVRADRGIRGDGRLHPPGDGRRGDASRPRGRDRHHRRPAGDRPGLQDADRPRRRRHLRGADLPRRGAGLLQLPGRGGPDRVRRGRDADRRARGGARPARRRGAAAQIRLLGADLPEPGRGDDVAGAAAAAGRAGATRGRCWWSRTTPTGCCASAASRCRRSTSSRAATSSSTSAPSRRSSPPGSASAGPWRRRR